MAEVIVQGNWHALAMHVAWRAAVVLVCWLFIVVATLVDLYYGRKAAKAAGEKLRSRKYRRTFEKVGDYVRVMAFALMFDALGGLFSWYDLPYMTLLYTAGALVVEFVSVREKLVKTRNAAADVPEVVRRIVAAASKKDALKVLQELAEEHRQAGSEKGGGA